MPAQKNLKNDGNSINIQNKHRTSNIILVASVFVPIPHRN